MTTLICSVALLRLFFWVAFPRFGMDVNSEFMFIAVSLGMIAVWSALLVRNGLRFPLAVLLTITVISLFYSKDQALSASFIMSQGLYIFLFYNITRMKPDKAYNILFVLFVASMLLSFKSIQEIPFINRTHSFLGWSTATASVLLLALPWALINFYNKRCIWTGLIALSLIIGLLATKSIMPTISLLIVIGLVLQNRWYYACLWVFAILGIIFLRGDIMTTINVRLEYLDQTWKLIEQHPFIGSGISTLQITGHAKTIYAHNSYLQIWAETGIIGFLAVCALVVRIWCMKPGKSIVERGVYWGLIAFLIDNLTNFTLLRYSSSIYFWVSIGCYCVIRKQNDVPKL